MLREGDTYQCARCGQDFVAEKSWLAYRRCRPCRQAAKRADYDKHRARYQAQVRRYRLEHPDREQQHKRERRARNPQTVAAAWQRRADWLRSGDVTREQLRAIYDLAGGMCHWCGNFCGIRVRFEPADPRGFDHLVSRSKGGRHTAANIVVSCRLCNAKRSDLKG